MKMTLALLLCLTIAAHAADEITVAANVTLASGNVSQNQKSGDLKFTMTNAAPYFASGIINVTNGLTVYAAANVNAPGYLWVKNTTTNYWDLNTNAVQPYVDMGATNAGAILPFARLMAGEVGCVPLAPGALVYFQSWSNNVALQYFLITR